MKVGIYRGLGVDEGIQFRQKTEEEAGYVLRVESTRVGEDITGDDGYPLLFECIDVKVGNKEKL